MQPPTTFTSLFGWALLATIAAGITACGGPQGIPDATDATDASIDSPPAATTVRFNVPATGDPPPLDIPFPSDLYRRDPDGTIVDTLADWSRAGIPVGGESLREGFGALDGFGLMAGAIFVLDGAAIAIDPASLPSSADATLLPDSSVVIVDLEAGITAGAARVRCRAGYNARPRTLVVQPDGVALMPGRRYAAVITTSVRTVDGHSVDASPQFVAIRDGAAGARATPVGMMYGDALDRLRANAGIEPSRVAGLAVFTTQTVPRQLRVLRDDLRAGRLGAVSALNTDPAMAMPFRVLRFGANTHAGWTATLDEFLGTPRRDAMGRDLPGLPSPGDGVGTPTGLAHDALGALLNGTMQLVDVRAPFAGTAARTDGTIALDAMGHASVRSTATVPITLTLPRSAAPAAGYPMVIFVHGGGGHRGYLAAMANEFARAGFGTAAIDLPFHSSRGAGGDRDTRSGTTGTYVGPDGLPDVPDPNQITHFLGDMLNFLAARDTTRQAALEVVQVYRLLANPALDLSSLADEYSGVAPRVDRSHIAYFGLSAGGIVGTLAAAIEPDIMAYALAVPCGGFYTVALADSPAAGLLTGGLLNTNFRVSISSLQRYLPFVQLAQAIFDGGDPAAYVADIARPPGGVGTNVYTIFSDGDEAAVRRCQEHVARGMGAGFASSTAMARPYAIPGVPVVMAPVRGNVSGRTLATIVLQPAGHAAAYFRYHDASYELPFPRDTDPRFVRLPASIQVAQPIVPLQRSIARFFTTTLAGAAEVDITGLDPVADFDGDGWCDTDETAGGTAFDPARHPAGAPTCPRALGF